MTYLAFSTMRPFYLKKEDAKEYFAKSKDRLAFLGIILGILAGGFYYPTIIRSFSLNSTNTLLTVLSLIILGSSILVSVITLAFSFSLLRSKQDFTKFDEKLKEYKEGEMIKTSELWSFAPSLFKAKLIIIFGLMVPLFAMLANIFLTIFIFVPKY